MKGELITDFTTLKMGDKIEWNDRVLQFLFITKRDDVMCRNNIDETYTINQDLSYYHHIEDKPPIIDYVGKWFYSERLNTIVQSDFIDGKLRLNNNNFDVDQVIKRIKSDEIIVKDTLEEIKEVYRAKNTITGNNYDKRK